ncbi:MAG: hypothetical protein JWQ21_3798 [Herminiimonas sp.]|nr:hypothetical protein [Herminiimonas sp.]
MSNPSICTVLRLAHRGLCVIEHKDWNGADSKFSGAPAPIADHMYANARTPRINPSMVALCMMPA